MSSSRACRTTCALPPRCAPSALLRAAFRPVHPGPSPLVVKRWTRHGKDRLYVETAEGEKRLCSTWCSPSPGVGPVLRGHDTSVRAVAGEAVNAGYWFPAPKAVLTIIRAAHGAGWYVTRVGRSPDRFDLLLAPVSKRGTGSRKGR